MKKKPDWTWPDGKRIAHAHLFDRRHAAHFHDNIIEGTSPARDILLGACAKVADPVLSGEAA